MSQSTLLVCALCRFPSGEKERDGVRGGQHLLDQLQAVVDTRADLMQTIEVKPVKCIAACDRACVAAFSTAGKQTYIFRDLSPTDSVDDLLKFAEQYRDAELGKVPYSERPECLKRSTLAILPPIQIPAPKSRWQLSCDRISH